MPELYLNHLKSFIKHSVDNSVTSDHMLESKLFTFDFQVIILILGISSWDHMAIKQL